MYPSLKHDDCMNNKRLSIYVHLWMHSCMHACMHAYIHTYIHTYMNVHTCWPFFSMHIPLLLISHVFYFPKSIFSIMVTSNAHWWYLISWPLYLQRKCMNYKRSHMHDNKLYSSYFSHRIITMKKGWPRILNDWMTDWLAEYNELN